MKVAAEVKIFVEEKMRDDVDTTAMHTTPFTTYKPCVGTFLFEPSFVVALPCMDGLSCRGST